MEQLEKLIVATLLSEVGRVCVRSGRQEYHSLSVEEATRHWLGTHRDEDVGKLAEFLHGQPWSDIAVCSGDFLFLRPISVRRDS